MYIPLSAIAAFVLGFALPYALDFIPLVDDTKKQVLEGTTLFLPPLAFYLSCLATPWAGRAVAVSGLLASGFLITAYWAGIALAG